MRLFVFLKQLLPILILLLRVSKHTTQIVALIPSAGRQSPQATEQSLSIATNETIVE